MEPQVRTMDSSARAALRAGAVRDVLEGRRKNDVAQRYGVTRQTLHNWVTRHRSGGTEALADRPRGRAPRRMLLPGQEAQVADAIRSQHPGTVAPRYTRWTKGAIVEYIARTFGVHIKPWQIEGHLRGWGFASYREARRAFFGHPADGRAAESASRPAPAALIETVAHQSGEGAGAIQQMR